MLLAPPYLEAGAVRVCSNHVERVTWLVLLPDSEGHKGGHVAGEEVLATCTYNPSRGKGIELTALQLNTRL